MAHGPNKLQPRWPLPVGSQDGNGTLILGARKPRPPNPNLEAWRPTLGAQAKIRNQVWIQMTPARNPNRILKSYEIHINSYEIHIKSHETHKNHMGSIYNPYEMKSKSNQIEPYTIHMKSIIIIVIISIHILFLQSNGNCWSQFLNMLRILKYISTSEY